MRFQSIVWCLLAAAALSREAAAQDLNLTQFYAAPAYLNPAFTGAVPMYRLATTYRNQWVQVPKGYESNLVSFDYNLIQYNSGFGLLAYNDRAGAVNFSTNHISALYSYAAIVGNNWNFRGGLQAGYTHRRASANGLVFGDQLMDGGPTAEDFGGAATGFADISAGLLAYNPKYWVGLSLLHLNSPRFERPGTNPEEAYRDFPTKFSFHAGAKIPVGKNRWLAPALLYEHQAWARQMVAGANFLAGPLFAGLSYRGMPFFQNPEGSIYQEAVSAVLGVTHKSLTVGYSYDYNLNGLRGRPGGSHEISLVLEPEATRAFKRKYKGKAYIDCPVFMSR